MSNPARTSGTSSGRELISSSPSRPSIRSPSTAPATDRVARGSSVWRTLLLHPRPEVLLGDPHGRLHHLPEVAFTQFGVYQHLRADDPKDLPILPNQRHSSTQIFSEEPPEVRGHTLLEVLRPPLRLVQPVEDRHQEGVFVLEVVVDRPLRDDRHPCHLPGGSTAEPLLREHPCGRLRICSRRALTIRPRIPSLRDPDTAQASY
jgi:hypothetical protein